MKVTATVDGALAAAARASLENADRRLFEMLTEIGRDGEELARMVAPHRSGHFVDTITHEVEPTAVSVGSTSRRAHIIEDGRRPGKMAPPALIADLFGVDDDEAFLIAREIGRTGTPAANVFEFTRKHLDVKVRKLAGDLSAEIGGLDRVDG